jgi:hypothetical protein
MLKHALKHGPKKLTDEYAKKLAILIMTWQRSGIAAKLKSPVEGRQQSLCAEDHQKRLQSKPRTASRRRRSGTGQSQKRPVKRMVKKPGMCLFCFFFVLGLYVFVCL